MIIAPGGGEPPGKPKSKPMKNLLRVLLLAFSLQPSTFSLCHAQPVQRGPYDTSTLYFAPSNSVYTNFFWYGTAYSNALMHTWMRTNTSLGRWEYFTPAGLVATNNFATNVWVSTNGANTFTSYWAAAGSLNGGAPGLNTNSSSGNTNPAVPITPFVKADLAVTASNLTRGIVIEIYPNNTAVVNGVITNWPASTTVGIQEAVKLLPFGNQFQPGGGVIRLKAGAPFYTTTTIDLAPNGSPNTITNPFNVTIEGQGLTAGALVGTFKGPVLRANGTNGFSPMNIIIKDLCIACTTNAFTNIVEFGNTLQQAWGVNVGCIANVDIGNCYFGPWEALTNQQAAASGPNINTGFSTPSAGIPGFIPRLCPIFMQFMGSDAVKIHDTHFFQCAAAWLSVDHARIIDNQFFYSGHNTDWTNTSPFSLGSALIFPGAINGDFLTMGNHFYVDGAAIFATGGFRYGRSVHDFYENTSYSILHTPDTTWLIENFNNISSGLVSIYPSYAIASITDSTVAAIDFTSALKFFDLQQSWGNFVLQSTFQITSSRFVTQFYLFSGGTTNTFGSYTNIPGLTLSSSSITAGAVFTNTVGTNHTFVLYDRTAKYGEVYTNSVSAPNFLYDFSQFGTLFNFDSAWSAETDNGLNPFPFVVSSSTPTNATVSLFNGYYNGDGRGITNAINYYLTNAAPANATNFTGWIVVTNNGVRGLIPFIKNP